MLNDRNKNLLLYHFIVFLYGFTSILGALISLKALHLKESSSSEQAVKAVSSTGVLVRPHPTHHHPKKVRSRHPTTLLLPWALTRCLSCLAETVWQPAATQTLRTLIPRSMISSSRRSSARSMALSLFLNWSCAST